MTFSDLLRVAAPGTTPDLVAIDAAATPGFDGDKDAEREPPAGRRGLPWHAVVREHHPKRGAYGLA